MIHNATYIRKANARLDVMERALAVRKALITEEIERLRNVPPPPPPVPEPDALPWWLREPKGPFPRSLTRRWRGCGRFWRRIASMT